MRETKNERAVLRIRFTIHRYDLSEVSLSLVSLSTLRTPHNQTHMHGCTLHLHAVYGNDRNAPAVYGDVMSVCLSVCLKRACLILAPVPTTVVDPRACGGGRGGGGELGAGLTGS